MGISSNPNLSVSSINGVLQSIKDGSETRRKIPLKEKGLQIHVTKPKTTSIPTLTIKYAHKSNGAKSCSYISLGVYDGTKASLDLIDDNYAEAKKLIRQGIIANFNTGIDEIIAVDGRVNNTGGMRIKAAAQLWLIHATESKSLSCKTYYSRYMKYLIDAFGNRLPKSISRDDMQGLLEQVLNKAIKNLNEQKLKQVTTSKKDINAASNRLDTEYKGHQSRNAAFNIYKLFFEWAIDNDLLDKSPLRTIAKLPVNDNTSVEITKDELVKYLLVLRGDNKLCEQQRRLLHLMLLTGMRPGELLNLKIKDINFEEKCITIRKNKSKTRKENRIPLSYLAWFTLDEQISATNYRENNDLLFPAEKQKNWHQSPKNKGKVGRNHLMNGCSLTAYQKRVCDMAEIRYFRPHGLRHLFTTLMAKMGVSPEIQRRVVSHAVKTDVHERNYNHHNYFDEKREAASRVTTYLSHLADNLSFDDFKESFDFWCSRTGEKFMLKNDMNLKEYFDLGFSDRIIEAEKTGLAQAMKDFYENESRIGNKYSKIVH